MAEVDEKLLVERMNYVVALIKELLATLRQAEVEEEFYPPDHHMHSSHRVADPDPYAGPAPEITPALVPAPADEGGTQSEFDLTNPDHKSP